MRATTTRRPSATASDAVLPSGSVTVRAPSPVTAEMLRSDTGFLSTTHLGRPHSIVSPVTDPGSAVAPTPFLRSLRTARSVAIAGIIFAVTLTATLYLFRSAFPFDASLTTSQVPSAEDISRGRVALILMPYVGISFLWFMGSLNYSIGHADTRLFTTVFVASGILFVAVCFVAGAVGAAELSALEGGVDTSQGGRYIPGMTVNVLLINYAARMAAVFCLAISAFGRLRRLLPAWLSWLGTATGIFLLLVPFGVPHVQFVFPAWVAILSVYLFVANPGAQWRERTNT